jgi:hypothetical protein
MVTLGTGVATGLGGEQETSRKAAAIAVRQWVIDEIIRAL